MVADSMPMTTNVLYAEVNAPRHLAGAVSDRYTGAACGTKKFSVLGLDVTYVITPKLQL
jgi:hypothetical protein